MHLSTMLNVSELQFCFASLSHILCWVKYSVLKQTFESQSRNLSTNSWEEYQKDYLSGGESGNVNTNIQLKLKNEVKCVSL